MILSNYNFSYYSDEETFLKENKDILDFLGSLFYKTKAFKTTK